MNRRGFFKRTIGALASAYLAPLLPKLPSVATGFVGPLTFKGIPITYDANALTSRVYFLAKDGPYVLSYKSSAERLHVWDGAPLATYWN